MDPALSAEVIEFTNLLDKDTTEISIDNAAFKLYYRIMFFILKCCCLVSSFMWLFWEKVVCLDDDNFPIEFLNMYCTVSGVTNYIPLRRRYPVHPGVKPIAEPLVAPYRHFYLWIPYILLFDALLNYAPHYIWKTWEDGHLKKCIARYKSPGEKKISLAKQKYIPVMVHYLQAHVGHHNIYASVFFGCEVLNFLVAFLQCLHYYLLFGMGFLTYGIDVFNWQTVHHDDRTDISYQTFPTTARCTITKYGPSGNLVRFDSICIIGMNDYNEKVYGFLWFWCGSVFVVSALHLIYRVGIICFPRAGAYMLRQQAGRLDEYTIKFVKTLKFGDLFVFGQIRKCMTREQFNEFLDCAARRYSYRKDV